MWEAAPAYAIRPCTRGEDTLLREERGAAQAQWGREAECMYAHAAQGSAEPSEPRRVARRGVLPELSMGQSERDDATSHIHRFVDSNVLDLHLEYAAVVYVDRGKWLNIKAESGESLGCVAKAQAVGIGCDHEGFTPAL